MALPLPYTVVDDEATQGNFDAIKSQFPLSRKHIKLETPHVVGDSGEPGFENSWVNFDVSTFRGARFWKDAVGVVHLEGLLTGGTGPGASAVLFTLPTGYRPALSHQFAVIANNALGRVDVEPDGQVVWRAGGTNAFLSISGITFLQEQ